MATSKPQIGGKHSKACLNCRIRRIKCDLELPACSQCLRTRKTCSGYRDEQTLMFRDESKKVVQKVTGSKAAPSQAFDLQGPQPSSSREVARPGPSIGAFSARSAPSPSILGQLSISHPDTDKGIEFFFDNYITFITSTPTGRAALPASPAWSFLFTNPVYSNACSAAGYAGLSNTTGDSSYMVTARKQYALSLQSHKSGIEAESDLGMSFESALILGVFELVVAGRWGVHLQGGAAIWKMMAAQDRTPSPRTQLYWVFLIFIKCLVSEDPSPPGMDVWAQQIQERLTPDDAPAAPLASTAARFVDLYTSVKRGELIDSTIIVDHAIALEAELQAWERDLPPAWHFTTEESENDLSDFPRRRHHYHNFWVARMLTNYRWVRILINNLLLFHLPRSSAQVSASLATIARLSTDVCESVSHFLEPCIIEPGQQTPFPVLAGCFVVIVPLAVVGCAVGVSDETHDWTIEVLEILGERMGIGGAKFVVGEVKRLRGEWAAFGALDEGRFLDAGEVGDSSRMQD